MAWIKFFSTAPPHADLAHWTIHADSGVVRLSTRQTDVDESGPDWDPLPPISMVVDGIVEKLNSADSPQSCLELQEHFREWAETGILKAFHSATVRRKFDGFLSPPRSFAIVSAPLDLGLASDQLSLLWSNDSQLTTTAIQRRQQAAQSR